MFNKIKIMFLSITAIMMLACGGPKEKEKEEETVKEQPKVRDTIVVAQGADATSLDPHATNDQTSSRVYVQLYDTLVKTDLDMEIVPGLAKSWEQLDSLTTVFKLREGVKFHNGEELKAGDVKFTIDRMLKFPRVQHIVQAVDRVEVVDDYTVKVITREPFGALLKHLSHTSASILNEKAVTEGEEGYGMEPVGTGAFSFVKWDAGDKIVLRANEEYFRGAPEIKNLVFKRIPEGSGRTIALERGEVDIVYDIGPIDVGAVKGNADLILVEEVSLSMVYLGFNMKREPYNNLKVREAIGYAIKVDDIINAVLVGQGIEANSPIGPKVFGHNANIKPPKHDIEKAKALLAEAGYPNGFKTRIWTNDDQIRVQVARLIKAQLEQVGIKADINIVEWGRYLDKTARGEHEMFLLGWVSVTGDADYGLYGLFHSTTQGGAGNRSFYVNPQVDDLLDRAKLSTDNDERIALYGEAQELVQRDLPIRALYHQFQNAGIQNDIEGFNLNPTGRHRIYGVRIKE